MLYCPKHFTLVDEVDCRDSIVDCPTPVEVDPAKDVIVTCGPCNRTTVVPTSRIMQGKVNASGTCQLSECASTVVLPVSSPPPSIDQAAKPRSPQKAGTKA